MENSTGDEMDTDGVLDVVQLQGCERPPVEYTVRNPVIQIRPSRRVTRYIRTEVLLYKSDVIRGNAVYAAFDLVRMGVIYVRHRHEPDDPRTSYLKLTSTVCLPGVRASLPEIDVRSTPTRL